MKKLIIVAFFNLFIVLTSSAQIGVGISSPDGSAILDVVSPGNNKGLLAPRMTDSQMRAITAPAQGLLVFNTTTDSYWCYKSGPGWNEFSGGGTLWNRSGTFTTLANIADKVGIGTTTPLNRLSIEGNMNISGHASIGNSAYVNGGTIAYGNYTSLFSIQELVTDFTNTGYNGGILNLYKLNPTTDNAGFWGIDNEILVEQMNNHSLDAVTPFYNNVIHMGGGNTTLLSGVENHVLLESYGGTLESMYGILNTVATHAQDATVNVIYGIDNAISIWQPYKTVPDV